jgi:putative ABC transport system substrate-binding protein
MIRRREFITLLGGAALGWPIAARAEQSANRVLRIGYAMASAADQTEGLSRVAAFLRELEKLGWKDGHNIRIEYRWGTRGAQKIRDHATELLALAPNVIVSEGSAISQELFRQTRIIPIVFVAASDPVGSGLVTSMSRPGGNLTGFTNFEFSIGGKWLEALKEIAPGIKRVLVLQGSDIGNRGLFGTIQTAAASLGIEPIAAVVRDAADIEHSISNFAQEPINGGLIVLPGQSRSENSDMIVALAARHRLPAMYSVRPYMISGGLMSYDTDVVDLYRQAASYVNRILRGEKPGDLPVQAPTKYEFLINLKTAKALGLDVPPSLLARADEVIE